jgi:hypothetical protein
MNIFILKNINKSPSRYNSNCRILTKRSYGTLDGDLISMPPTSRPFGTSMRFASQRDGWLVEKHTTTIFTFRRNVSCVSDNLNGSLSNLQSLLYNLRFFCRNVRRASKLQLLSDFRTLLTFGLISNHQSRTSNLQSLTSNL